MIRYHVVEKRDHIYLIKKSVSLYYAKTVQRVMSERHPNRIFRVVPVDVWNQLLSALDRF